MIAVLDRQDRPIFACPPGGVGTVLIWDFCVPYTRGGAGTYLPLNSGHHLWFFEPCTACAAPTVLATLGSTLGLARPLTFFTAVPLQHHHCLCPSTNSARDKKVKWLDAGSTPDPVNSQPHSGHVWLKSGCSEAIPWHKVRLTKLRNVDLTSNGVWAMPLNAGWVPVKARRLQDWEKLKHVPVHKQGDVCPNGVPALPEKGNAHDDERSE